MVTNTGLQIAAWILGFCVVVWLISLVPYSLAAAVAKARDRWVTRFPILNDIVSSLPRWLVRGFSVIAHHLPRILARTGEVTVIVTIPLILVTVAGAIGVLLVASLHSINQPLSQGLSNLIPLAIDAWASLTGWNLKGQPPDAYMTEALIGGAAVGVAIISSVVRPAVSGMQRIWIDARERDYLAVFSTAVFVGVACAGITLTLLNGGEAAEKLMAPASPIQLTVGGGNGGATPSSRFTVTFEEGGKDSLRIVDSLGPSSGNDPKGSPVGSVQLSEAYKSMIRTIAASLHACVVEEADQVEVLLEGYASTSRWEEIDSLIAGTTSSGDDLSIDRAKLLRDQKLQAIRARNAAHDWPSAFNIWLAEARVDAVRDELFAEWSELSQEFPFRQNALRITRRAIDHRHLVRAQFVDTDPFNVYSTDRGRFNRRVDISLINVADCGPRLYADGTIAETPSVGMIRQR